MGRPPQEEEPLEPPRQIRFTVRQGILIEELRRRYSEQVQGVYISSSAVIRKALELGLSALQGMEERKRERR